jgi:hypothetical protein
VGAPATSIALVTGVESNVANCPGMSPGDSAEQAR